MGKVCTLFPQFYYHGEVENHQQLKDKLLSELTDDKLSQPRSGIVVFNHHLKLIHMTDFSWDYFYECIKPNLGRYAPTIKW